MLLTVYYMAATILQSFRLKAFLAKIARQLNERASVVFYHVPDESKDTDVSDVPVSSELCTNQREGRIADVLWHHNTQRGCTIKPRQLICIDPWITFPRTARLNIPIKMNDSVIRSQIADPIFMLVEARFGCPDVENPPREPFMGFSDYTNSLFIEEYGEPVAWRVDSHFAFLMRTDNERLLKFILASFVVENYSINNDLQLIRIQTVDVEGEAQPFESIQQHTKKDVFEIEPRVLENPELRQKYISLLNDLCYLAHQANEFQLERARRSKPDLIASSCMQPRNGDDAEDKSTPTGAKSSENVAAVEVSGAKTKKKHLKRTKRSEDGFIPSAKPPNILVYSESSAIRDSALGVLKQVLKPDTYTVYPLTPAEVKRRIWQDNTRLLIVCGQISSGMGSLLLEYYLNRFGNILCLCSDLLHLLLPNFRTAEVREQELAQFSYNRWNKVHMMHHIFCYQPSPIKKHFSHDSDDTTSQQPQAAKDLCPKSVEVVDTKGRKHPVDVQVLGVEETWRTPSILLATNRTNNGRAIFSQVHLETDPSQFEDDERKFEVLKNSNVQRLEILGDLLSTHLNVEVQHNLSNSAVSYTVGYFLGEDALKTEFLQGIKAKLDASGCLSSGVLQLSWIEDDQAIPEATERFLPIHVKASPVGFNGSKYFEVLATKKIGRLVIYVPIVTTSMDVLDKLNLHHGLVVIPKYQTNGSGRSKNKWLSAEGCLMFTVQLRISMGSLLGQRIPLVQHLMATAIVNAILSEDGYQDLDLRIKWPNDVYANGTTKIGGLIVTTTIEGSHAVCNVGVGLNLNNGSPTTCVNDLIRDLNRISTEGPLREFEPEELFATIFNELERLLDEVDSSGSFETFYDLYYHLWLHSEQEVQVQDSKQSKKSGIVSGIDEYGYLKVVISGGDEELSVHPDGNSFDMIRGLILPKFN